jgi:hypothetical protein
MGKFSNNDQKKRYMERAWSHEKLKNPHLGKSG